MGEPYKLWSSSSCSLLQPLTSSFLLCPKILLSTLRDQAPPPIQNR
jgi:hypothetical protein